MGSWRLPAYLIPLRSWRRAQQSPAFRFRIGPAVVEESDIELGEPPGTYKDNPYNGQRFHEFSCDSEAIYTTA